MGIIQLHHDPRLAYAAKENLPALSQKALDLAKENTVITFRNTCPLHPHRIQNEVNACTRFLNLPHERIVFSGIESDSQLAPLILWDAAHCLAIGATITLLDDLTPLIYLERDYFKKSLAIEKRENGEVIFRKIALLPAERDAGLKRFSFCIPTGDGDATGLNVVVKRILELDVPEKEILLCGRPGKNFRYFNQVRIVGEDIPAPPIWITKKKNVLAEEARFENLCILHDRVFLPFNFMSALTHFGDYYPFAGFQSIWFDDRLNLSPVRYSDYGAPTEDYLSNIVAINREGNLSAYVPSLFAEVEKQNFTTANPLRYQHNHYLTGSLYLVKKHVWALAPQNEGLFWAEFEDIEQAQRAATQGIPHRIVPFAFTQSLFARPLLYFGGYSRFIAANGQARIARKALPLPSRYLKPLIKLSEQAAKKRFDVFVNKYAKKNVTQHAEGYSILHKMIAAINLASIPFRKSSIQAFIDDIERYVLCDQMGFGTKEWLLEQFIAHRSNAKINLGRHFKELIFQISQRPSGKRFYKHIDDYFPNRSQAVKFCSWLTALRLARTNGDYLYHPQGLRGFYQAILESTPFIDFAGDAS